MYRVEFTDVARSTYRQMLGACRLGSDGACKRRSEDRVAEVRDGVRQLQNMDAQFDIPLVGRYLGVNALTCGQSELWYARPVGDETVIVLYIGEATIDTTSTYHLFADLVLSGRFNVAMSGLGVSIPVVLPDRLNLRLQ